MAQGDTVQTATGTAANGAAAVTFSAAVAGNLLVFVVGRSGPITTGETWGTPTDWTDLPQTTVNAGNVGGAGWYKVAVGGETSITSVASVDPGNWCAAVVEIEGPFADPPLDETTDNEDNLASAVVEQTSGTTGTTSVADAVALAWFVVDNGGSFGTKQYSNSFAEAVTASSGARAAVAVAKRIVSATGAYESTISYSAGGSADEMYGAIAVFSFDGGAGPTDPERGLIGGKLLRGGLLRRGLVH